MRTRTGRSAEFRDLAERSAACLLRHHDIFHVTHPQVWGPSRAPTVASILDLIPIDLTGYRRTGLKTGFFLSRAAQASVVLTISEFTAGRIVEHFHVDPARIVVAPLFPTAAFRPSRDTASDRPLSAQYVLTVVDMATPDPRKRSNWIRPLAAELKRAGITLVVVGSGTDTRSAALGDAVALGRISDDDLARTAQHAVCFAYFSAYEGLGLPALEAMAAGAAVVATSNTGLEEVVADAGILIDERSRDWSAALLDDSHAAATRKDLAEACIAIARSGSLRAELRARSLVQASRFSQERFFEGLAKSYRMAACG